MRDCGHGVGVQVDPNLIEIMVRLGGHLLSSEPQCLTRREFISLGGSFV